MNREIKFRGKGIADNEWYYGDLIQVESGRVHYFIIQDYEIKEDRIELNTCASPEVIPETIGQYTGLKDKNGKEIWENDIVEITRECIYEQGIIVLKNGCFFIKTKENLLALYNCELNNYKVKVIGNITDNPELLGGE